MTLIDVPSETLLVEMGNDGLNILETTMQMSSRDESAPVECDICSKPPGKMKECLYNLVHQCLVIVLLVVYKLKL